MIGTYLAEEDSKPGGAAEKGVAGAVLVSCPLDPHSSHAGLSDPSRPAGLLYDGAIAAELRRYFYKYQTQVTEHPEVDEDALNIAEMRTIRDFEKALIVVTHGFKDIDEYYDYFSPARIIPSIRTPTLYLIARDDPFVGEREQCEHAIRQSKHVALAHVPRSSGRASRFWNGGPGCSDSAGPIACWASSSAPRWNAGARRRRRRRWRLASRSCASRASPRRRGGSSRGPARRRCRGRRKKTAKGAGT